MDDDVAHAEALEFGAGPVAREPPLPAEPPARARLLLLVDDEPDVRQVLAGHFSAAEDITVHEVPLAEVDAWLAAKAKTGVLVDPKIYAGLYFVRNQPGA